MTIGRRHRYIFLSLAAIAYVARPVSYSVVLGSFSPYDPVPYAMFDRHSMLEIISALAAFGYATPFAYLATGVLANRIAASASELPRRMQGFVVLTATMLALPSYAQIGALGNLPLEVCWPVLLSSLVWAGAVFVFCRHALRQQDAAKVIVRLRHLSFWLAGTIVVPKIVLSAIALATNL